MPMPGQDPISALEMTRLALWKMYNQSTEHTNGGSAGGGGGALKMPNIPVSLPSLPPGLQSAAADLIAQQDKALNLQKAAMEAMSKAELPSAVAAAKVGQRHDNNDNETTDDVTITRTTPRDGVVDVVRDDDVDDEDEECASSLSPPPIPATSVTSGTKRGHDDDEVAVNGSSNGGSPVKKKRTVENLNAMAGANIKIASRSMTLFKNAFYQLLIDS